MAGRINNQPPSLPFWPWPRNVREKLVDRAQLNRGKGKKRTGDAKNPPLASAALLEFMGPGHSSEELRLPLPVHPRSGEALASAQGDLPTTEGLLEKAGEMASGPLLREIARLQIPPERMDRLKSLLARESQMLNVMGRLQADSEEIQRRMKDEQKTRGY